MTLQLDPPLFGNSGEKVFNLDAFGLIEIDYCNNPESNNHSAISLQL